MTADTREALDVYDIFIARVRMFTTDEFWDGARRDGILEGLGDAPERVRKAAAELLSALRDCDMGERIRGN